MNHNFYILSKLSRYTGHFINKELHSLGSLMITENIAKDATLLISEYMLFNVEDSIHLRQFKQLQRASNLWNCIKKEFQTTEVARNIVLDMETTPDNEIVQAIFRHQLSKHLKKDDDFAWDIEQILYIRDFRIPRKEITPQANHRFVPVTAYQNNSQAIPTNFVSDNTQAIKRTNVVLHSGD